MPARGLEIGVVLMFVLQGISLASQPTYHPWTCPWVHSKSDSVAETRDNGVLDLGDGTSETTMAIDQYMLRVGLFKLVIDGGGDEAICLLIRARILSLDSPFLVFTSLNKKVRAL